MSPDAPAQVGATLGRYKVMEPLDDGPLGARFKVREVVAGTYHTLRLTPPVPVQVHAALLTEGRVQRLVSQPGLALYTDAFAVDERVALVSDWLDGTTLGEVLADGGLDTPEALALFDAMLARVGAAHARGLTHEALTPDTIALVEGAAGLEVRIADFGLHRAMAGASALSPDVAADVYGLAAVLRAMLSAPGATGIAHDAPAPVAGVLERALHPDPEQRYADVQALAAALRGEPGEAEAEAAPVPPAPTGARTAPPGGGLALRLAATAAAVGTIVVLGALVHTQRLATARAASDEAAARLADDLERQLAAAARLRDLGAGTPRLEQAVTQMGPGTTPAERTERARSLCDALEQALHDAPPGTVDRDPGARRELERMLATDREHEAAYRAALEARRRAEGNVLTPVADALGL